MHAFRCKTCGCIHPAEHAGECDCPHACSVCGAGVSFNAKGVKSLQPDNWEILADATAERLAELGLEASQVARHTGKAFKENPGAQHVYRTASDGIGSQDTAG